MSQYHRVNRVEYQSALSSNNSKQRSLSTEKFRKRLLLASTALVAVSIGMFAASTPFHATDYTWDGGTSDYNNIANWNPVGAPTVAGDTATFAGTGTTSISVTAAVAPDSWTFTSLAQAYTISGDTVTFGGAGIVNNSNSSNQSISNVIAGTGGVQQLGLAVMALTGANTYSGATVINSGTLAIAAANNLGNTSGITFGGTGTGILRFDGSFSTGVAVTLDQNGTFNTNGNNNTLSGVIGGTGGLTKSGTGTLTLSGTNTYTGGTIITAGTLQLGASNVLASTGAINISAGATFDLNNFNQTVGTLTGAAGSFVTLGTGTLTAGTSASSVFAGVMSGGGGRRLH